MDKIEPQLGGMDLYNDDFVQLQNNIEARFGASLITLTNRKPTFIVSGIVMTDNGQSGIDFTEGWVVVDGKLCYLPATTLPPQNLGEKITFDTTTIDDISINSIKIKDNGSTYFSYQKSRAELIIGLTGDPAIDCCYFELPTQGLINDENIWRIEDVMNGKEISDGYVQVGGSFNNWDLTTGSVTYRKDIWGYVHLKGATPEVISNSGNSPIFVIVLPLGYCPKNITRGIAVSDTDKELFKIHTDGRVELTSGYDTGNNELIIPPFKAV